MKIKKKLMSVLLMATMLLSCQSVFAGGEVDETAQPFSVDGNLTIDDNLSTKDNKEFYSVHSKEGGEFYIIVDKASDENNVYFLNAVDSQDLMQLVDNEDAVWETVTTTVETTTVETTTSDTTVEATTATNKSNSQGSIMPVILIALGVGGIAFYLKKKKKAEETDDDTENSENAENNEPLEDKDSTDDEAVTEEVEVNEVEEHPLSNNEPSAFGTKDSEFTSFDEDEKQ